MSSTPVEPPTEPRATRSQAAPAGGPTEAHRRRCGWVKLKRRPALAARAARANPARLAARQRSWQRVAGSLKAAWPAQLPRVRWREARGELLDARLQCARLPLARPPTSGPDGRTSGCRPVAAVRNRRGRTGRAMCMRRGRRRQDL